LQREVSDARVLPDLSDSDVRARLRPVIVTTAFLMFFVSLAGVFLMLPLGKSGRVDFRHLYTAGYMVRTGHAADVYNYELYEKFQNEVVGPAQGALPFNHLAYETLFYAPFSLLTYRHAYFAFLLANLLILAAAIRILRPLFSPLAQLWTYLPVAIVVCFLPVAIALIEGQDSLILLALFAAATSKWYSGKDLEAGIFLGLTLFKFQYAIPVGLLLFVWRRWRVLAGFTVSGLAVTGISFWLAGSAGMVSYAKSILAMSAKYSSANGVLYGIHPDGMANLRGIAYVWTGGSISATHWIVLIGSAVAMLWGALKRPSLPVALLAAMLVSYHQVIADTGLLMLPVGLALAGNIREITTRSGVLVLVLCWIAVIAPTFLLFANTRFYLEVLPAAALFAFWDDSAASPKILGS
jgi:glycosyl transferase family 87